MEHAAPHVQRGAPAAGLSSRAARLARLRERGSAEVLVIGGGINGISAYRELALQGVDVVLVDRGDYCSGASGALSRMIHGGLRYLENGEFGLVRESLAERERLLRNAPHYVAPLPTVVPIFDYTAGVVPAVARFLGLRERPARRGALIVKAGLSLYDLFTRQARSMPRHSFAGRRATRRRWPAMTPAARCTATYYDAWITYPERLGFELIEDVAASCPNAAALNYVAFEGVADGAVVLRDGPTGERFRLTPGLVVNATGAWIDLTNGRLDAPAAPPLMGGTKGSHLILRHPALLRELDGKMVYYENQEGRVCILFPYFGNVLVGSTDIRVDEPDAARCEADERDYILDSLRFVFPGLRFGPDDVAYTYSGVRPLPRSGASTTAKVSRNHSTPVVPAGPGRPFDTLCMVGGKWTTFRAFGEGVADGILGRLGRARRASTRHLAIGGGADFPRGAEARGRWVAAVASDTGLTAARVSDLLDRYGTRARRVAGFLVAGPDRPLAGNPAYSRREVLFFARHEDALTPEDVAVRRTALAISATLRDDTLDEIADILAEDAGWSPAEREACLARSRAILADKHGRAPAARLLADA